MEGKEDDGHKSGQEKDIIAFLARVLNTPIPLFHFNINFTFNNLASIMTTNILTKPLVPEVVVIDFFYLSILVSCHFPFGHRLNLPPIFFLFPCFSLIVFSSFLNLVFTLQFEDEKIMQDTRLCTLPVKSKTNFVTYSHFFK